MAFMYDYLSPAYLRGEGSQEPTRKKKATEKKGTRHPIAVALLRGAPSQIDLFDLVSPSTDNLIIIIALAH
jgi:hypothetical protein